MKNYKYLAIRRMILTASSATVKRKRAKGGPNASIAQPKNTAAVIIKRTCTNVTKKKNIDVR